MRGAVRVVATDDRCPRLAEMQSGAFRWRTALARHAIPSMYIAYLVDL